MCVRKAFTEWPRLKEQQRSERLLTLYSGASNKRSIPVRGANDAANKEYAAFFFSVVEISRVKIVKMIVNFFFTS